MVRSTRKWLLCAMGTSALLFGAPALGAVSVATVQAQTAINVTGQVRSSEGDAIAGATVRYGSAETSTNRNGRFSIRLTSANNLVFSAVGYTSQSVYVAKDTALNIVLLSSESVLDEVVVIGYGTVKRRDLTGAVASVKADDIALAPVANPIEALQGRVAGLDIARNDGRAGASSDILLRGNRSLTAGS